MVRVRFRFRVRVIVRPFSRSRKVRKWTRPVANHDKHHYYTALITRHSHIIRYSTLSEVSTGMGNRL